MDNFWQKLNKPFVGLSPMEDVTDPAFRRIIAKYGHPDVIFTEFASADGLASEEGRERIKKDLIFDDSERPVVAQLFGSKPKNFKVAAKIIAELGFSGIDINMGCPDKDVVKQGAGCALIQNHELAREVVLAVKEGAGEIPVSIKTRIGYSADEINAWIPSLLETKPAAITIHGRTKKEMYKVPTHWDTIARAAEMAKGSGTLIIGNGDIQSRREGIDIAERYGLHGILIGRAVFGNPWIFNENIQKENLSLKAILDVLIEHSGLFEELEGESRHFMHMRKHFSWYLKGFPDTKELKMALMQTENTAELTETINRFFGK
jgi:nifR3 family TIM-barrel protein